MPPHVCPRCKHTNPEAAVFCYFDGEALRGGQAAAAAHRLASEFVFPSGRRCRTYDELAQGCQEEWAAARDLLRKGFFQQYFTGVGRQDLARAAQEAMRQPDPNIGLTNLLGSLPVTRSQGPRLDLNPRRLNLGSVLAGESRQVEMTVSNQGQGTLHGTVTVAEGGAWLRVGGGNGQCELKTAREQRVSLQIDTRGLPAAQTYGGKLTVATNGGVVEVPVRLDLTAHPFPSAPFKGVRAPRDLAEKMRAQPKAAVPLLESGAIARWFDANGWNYPVRGTPARGVAGVQQFFEQMGLSKPPTVQLSQTEIRCPCTYPDPLRSQVTLSTSSKKWVYANVESDSPWLKVLTPQVAGPQQAAVGFEIDSRLVPRGQAVEGRLQLSANGGQNLTLRVRTQVLGSQKSATGRLLQPVLTGALALLLLRLLLAPLVDGYAREAASAAAAAKLVQGALPAESPLEAYAGWLQLPWAGIFLGSDPLLLAPALGLDNNPLHNRTQEFRDYFTSHFLRIVTLWTWWLGALAGASILWRRGGGLLSVPWGLVAGGAAGLAGSATLACLVLIGDLVPNFLWGVFGLGGGAVLLPVWIVVALLCWTALGAGLGVVLGLTGPLGRPFLAPMQAALSWFFRTCGMERPAGYFAA